MCLVSFSEVYFMSFFTCLFIRVLKGAKVRYYIKQQITNILNGAIITTNEGNFTDVLNVIKV